MSTDFDTIRSVLERYYAELGFDTERVRFRSEYIEPIGKCICGQCSKP